MIASSLVENLIRALQAMPGIGPKSAQRIAFHLLQHGRPAARQLSIALAEASERVGYCTKCNNFSDTALCAICTNGRRDATLLCVVEHPPDVSAIEQSGDYSGLYFVLMGHLSPLDGIGPRDIGLDKLRERLTQGEVKEVILATGTTSEGEATAHFIREMTQETPLRVSRIAFGVPLGGDLELVDSGTLAHAITRRQEM
ncbi:MAG: recombination mediator RecR [Gammaproteobacteria bacterium]